MKYITATIRLTLQANKATPSPLLGQALGQYGINIATFCKEFNEKTKIFKDNIYVPTLINVFDNSSQIEVIVRSPSTSYLLKSTLCLSKGFSSRSTAKIKKEEIYHLAAFAADTRAAKPRNLGNSLKTTCKTIIGTAKSMGLLVEKT